MKLLLQEIRRNPLLCAPGPHGLVNYPQNIAELKRILHLHLKTLGTSKPTVAQATP